MLKGPAAAAGLRRGNHPNRHETHMGTGASRPLVGPQAPPTPAATLPHSASPATLRRPTFSVWTTPSPGAPALPVLLRLDSEALVVLDEATGTQVFQAFYYRILCWGYSPTQFYWKSTGAEEGGAAAGEGGAGAAAAAAAAADTFTVNTGEGKEIEAQVMGAVRALMGRMDARGVGSAEFPRMLAALTSLADDGLTDQALTAVKQMMLGRAFDARQATALLGALGALSPFDKVEAACALYPDALLHPSTFPVILADSFEDPGERDNIAHRLGLRVTADGNIEVAETVASKTIGAKR
jgi:hypothetical protein